MPRPAGRLRRVPAPGRGRLQWALEVGSASSCGAASSKCVSAKGDYSVCVWGVRGGAHCSTRPWLGPRFDLWCCSSAGRSWIHSSTMGCNIPPRTTPLEGALCGIYLFEANRGLVTTNTAHWQFRAHWQAAYGSAWLAQGGAGRLKQRQQRARRAGAHTQLCGTIGSALLLTASFFGFAGLHARKQLSCACQPSVLCMPAACPTYAYKPQSTHGLSSPRPWARGYQPVTALHVISNE